MKNTGAMASELTANRIVVIGDGLSGNLAAAYLRRRLPDHEVVIVGKENKKRPIVGESTVEVTAHFLHAIGLGECLEEQQYHKYGLTFYYKCDPDDANCRRYVVHEAPGVIRLPAYQLNRGTFDDSVRKMNKALGVAYVPKTVKDIVFRQYPDGHDLHLGEPSGDVDEILSARWIVDATGRNRLLARKLNLTKSSPNNRSSFWFRLSAFDRSVFRTIVAVKPKHLCFDSYYATHHFLGAGYWIWMIPLKQDGQELISIGLTYRPDLICHEVRSLDDFMAVVRRDHPMIAEFVDSGRVVDLNFYGNYMYEAARYYSRDGWFLIGDAAFPSDPINSAGMATVAHQIPQVAAMILKSANNALSPDYVNALQGLVEGQLSLQDSWTRWYEIMDNPVKMAWTVIAANAAYFHIVLPAYLNGAFLDGRYARALKRRLPRQSAKSWSAPFGRLLDAVAARSRGGALEHYIPNVFPRVINWDVYRANNHARPYYGGRYFRVLASLRWTLIRLAGVSPVSATYTLALVGDIVRACAVVMFPGYLFGRKSPDHMCSPWAGDGAFLHFPQADQQGMTSASHEKQMAVRDR
jgi:flavin-dependent dehydrogenase